MKGSEVNRRQFIVGSASLGGGLILGMHFSTNSNALAAPESVALRPNAFLQITPDNQVIFQVDKAEMGQGVYATLPTIAAEELEIDPRRIIVQLADTHEDYQDPIQMTGGSASIVSRWDVLRTTGAAAKTMLIAAAAKKFGVDPLECHADDGVIYHTSSNQSVKFGDVATLAAAESVPEEPALKSAAQYKYLGKSLRRLDGGEKSTGQAEFGIDVQLPGMVNAVVMRNPHFGPVLGTFNATKAKQAAGVIDVFAISTGIAVVADTYWHARQASKLVEVNWDKGALAGLSSARIRQDWIAKASEEGRMVEEQGEGIKGLEGAADIHEAIYELPYLAHATMEPQNTTARFNPDGRCEVWSPSQGGQVTQGFVAAALDMPREDIIVHTTLMGGGFGRRAIPDFAVDAAEIARKLTTPVKVIWSREDDTRHDYYRPATYNVLRAGLDASGMVHTWQHKLVAPSMMVGMLANMLPQMAPEWIPDWLLNALAGGLSPLLKTRDPTTTEGAADHPYQIANRAVQHVYYDAGIPLGPWRSVGHSHNAFVTESFIDELAHRAGRDPYQFRKQLLPADAREHAVLDLAVAKANWGKMPENIYQGLAVHQSFGSVVAEVVDLRVEDGKVSIEKVTCAVNCGLALNPDLVKAQIESAVIYGLTAALKGEITFEDGAVVQSNFHDYQMLRMNESPEIEVHILPGGEKPTGVGEPGTPPIAPALANALFAATGKRHRRLPLKLG